MKLKYKDAIPYAIIMVLALSASFLLSPIWGGGVLFWIGLIVGVFMLLVAIGMFLPDKAFPRQQGSLVSTNTITPPIPNRPPPVLSGEELATGGFWVIDNMFAVGNILISAWEGLIPSSKGGVSALRKKRKFLIQPFMIEGGGLNE